MSTLIKHTKDEYETFFGIEELTPREILLAAWDMAHAIDHGVMIEAPHGKKKDWTLTVSPESVGNQLKLPTGGAS